MTYYISNYNNFEFTSKKDIINDSAAFKRAIKLSLKRKYHKSLIDVMIDLDFIPNTCNHCGHFIEPNLIKYHNIENKIFIDYIGYENINYRFCKTKNCIGAKLNPNSIEFVKKTYSFNTDEEAKTYIHSRNKTPFYAENHSSIEDYKNYQRRDKQWYIDNNINYEKYIEKANYHKSLDYKIKQYGKELGTQIYNESCKEKSLFSKEILEKKINNSNDIIKIRKNFLISSSHNRLSNDMFESLNTMCEYLYKNIPITYKTFITYDYISKNILRKKYVELFCEINNITKEEFANIFLSYCYDKTDIKTGYKYKLIKHLLFGSLYITNEGNLLRSKFELDFYIEMCKYDLNKKPYYTDKKYPNQINTNYKYDFCFPEINFYIEIAGLDKFETYKTKLNIKKQLFSPYIVYTRDDIQLCIDEILSKYNNSKENMHEIMH